MEEITKFVLELYEMGFISSILFILYVIFNFGIKWYGRVKKGKDTKFIMSNKSIVVFWISIALIISYLI